MGPGAATLPSPGTGTPGSRRRRAAGTPGRRAAGTAGRLVLVTAGTCLLAARTVRRVEVAGGSMAPTFLPGDRLLVLARPFGRPARPAPGDVVAAADPREPARTLVKRVAAVDHRAGTLDLRGDDPGASTDSREFGPVPIASVVGRVVYRYAPPGRSGAGPWPTGYDRS